MLLTLPLYPYLYIICIMGNDLRIDSAAPVQPPHSLGRLPCFRCLFGFIALLVQGLTNELAQRRTATPRETEKALFLVIRDLHQDRVFSFLHEQANYKDPFSLSQ